MPKYIYNAQPEVFIDDDLMRPIKVYTAIDTPILVRKFIGSAPIQVPGYAPMESPFEIKAKSLTKAFELYDEAYKVEVDRVNEEIDKTMADQKNQIIAPGKEIIV